MNDKSLSITVILNFIKSFLTQEVDEINRNAGILAERNVPDVDVDWMCKGEKGLLTKIVQVMMKVEVKHKGKSRFSVRRICERLANVLFFSVACTCIR